MAPQKYKDHHQNTPIFYLFLKPFHGQGWPHVCGIYLEIPYILSGAEIGGTRWENKDKSPTKFKK